MSLGGGGGSTGNVVAVTGGAAASSNVALGGVGGKGGHGDRVRLTASGAITTRGNASRALVAESVGGGGGTSGSVWSMTGASGLDYGHSLGGTGGKGGDAGVVTVDNSADLTTTGAGSSALFAQSVGGGGGDSGAVVTGQVAGAVTLQTAIGGRGGAGGDADSVTVDNSGEITTANVLSDGLVAQSVGGGGGAGGIAVAASVASLGDASVSLGGSGAVAGDGGTVTVTNGGDITTKVALSHAIFAQSVGGGGGLGGVSVAANGVSYSGSVSVSLGGSGASGGDAADVSVVSHGKILSTEGPQSYGLFAQSVGGGGGASGVTYAGSLVSRASVGVAVGGDGGNGGNGADVTVAATSDIETKGAGSIGLFAQSASNGGGAASFTAAANGAARYGSANVAIGGRGGDGGTAGKVDVTSTGDISTAGDGAYAILAQSVGGGGGVAAGTLTGSAISFSGAPLTPTAQVAIGGRGGNGGRSGEVVVDNSGALSTLGDGAHALVAQSVGGKGGMAKFAATGSLGIGGGWVGDASVAIGGEGGNGAVAGTVDVTNSGAITTRGYRSRGILAQSVGGSGGSGGSALAVSGALSLSEGTIDASVALGGAGGAGAEGADVAVDNSGDITTEDLKASAILAQSIGGGGGNGGASAVFQGVLDPTTVGPGEPANTTVQVSVAIGGKGGNGKDAGAVFVKNSGALLTMSRSATQDSKARPNAELHGIFAQSVGGGGGNGGNAFTGILDLGFVDGPYDPAISENTFRVGVNVGGSGGAAGDADTVTVENAGAITTEGDGSAGIRAQSVGGGGGAGGNASNYTFYAPGKCTFIGAAKRYDCEYKPFGEAFSYQYKTSLDLSVNVGGNGGAAGNGAAVTVTNAADILTSGVESHGIFAQSVGGGGGDGGSASTGIAGATDSRGAALVASALQGLRSTSIVTQFTQWNDIDIQIGGKGGAKGDGDTVDVTNTARIETTGASSYGIFAQSVGGGGGVGGAASAGAVGNAAIGGTGSGGGEGSAVTVVNSGQIVTGGPEGVGIYAQSVGGGGGHGGNAALTFAAAGSSLNIGLGATNRVPELWGEVIAGDGGNGGEIHVTSGRIMTKGLASHGVWAESIGGSGGSASYDAFTNPVPFIPGGSSSASMGDKGDAGDVMIEVDEAIVVKGVAAHGVIAKSAAGKNSTSGTVAVDVTGSVRATGANGRAILTQSDGQKTSGDTEITVAKGASVTTSAAARATVQIHDGGTNTVTNHGVIAKDWDADVASDEDYVLQGLQAAIEVENDGVISGAFSVGVDVRDDNTAGKVAASRLHNRANGVWELGKTSALGSGSRFVNDGTISAGPVGTIATSTIEGDADTRFRQTDTGMIVVDHQFGDGADRPARSDLLTFTTPTTLEGEVVPNIIGVNLPSSGELGEFSIVEVTAGDSTTDLTVRDTGAVDYTLVQSGSGDGLTAGLRWSVDLSPWDAAEGGVMSISRLGAPGEVEGVTPSVDRFAGYLDALIDERVAERRRLADGTLAPARANYGFVDDLITYVLRIEDEDRLVDNYDIMMPKVHAAPLDALALSSIVFAEDLASCPSLSADDTVAVLDPKGCAWMRLGSGYFNRDGSDRMIGYDDTSFGLSAGGQFEVAPDLYAGLGFSYAHSWLSASRLNRGEGNRFHAGATIRKVLGPWTMSGSVSGGLAVYDLERLTVTPSDLQTVGSIPTSGVVAAHARIARTIEGRFFYLEPTLDVGLHHQWRAAFSEHGADGLGMRFKDFDETFGTVNPFLTIGSAVTIAGADTKLYARLGALAILGDDDRTIEASFADVPSGGPTFSFEDKTEMLYADVGLGLETTLGERWSLNLETQALISASEQAFAGSARFDLRF